MTQTEMLGTMLLEQLDIISCSTHFPFNAFPKIFFLSSGNEKMDIFCLSKTVLDWLHTKLQSETWTEDQIVSEN